MVPSITNNGDSEPSTRQVSSVDEIVQENNCDRQREGLTLTLQPNQLLLLRSSLCLSPDTAGEALAQRYRGLL
ncbi:unnamed protein product [Heligmosomoides polygyrus]|uniref:Uncharacterized protein n=1 Tax=Heligmosomoides polygyrus TaxID=6339 RepID=A0A183FTJ2_HELPZ|nr:unnamed protein product [Heligmosomoides polygyrus]